MPNVNEHIQPLQDVLDKREELEAELTEKTGEELKEAQEEMATTLSEQLKEAFAETKTNMAEYIAQLPNTPDAEKISEAEFLKLAVEVSTKMKVPLEDVLILVGLKPASTSEEVFGMDEDLYLDKDELEQEVYDPSVKKSVTTDNTLDRHIMSVFHEYAGEGNFDALATTPEGLAEFLNTKWEEVRTSLLAQYQNAEPAEAGAFSGTQSGMLDKLMPTDAIAKNSELEKFFDAIQAVGGNVNPDKWINDYTGELDEAMMNEAVDEQIQSIKTKASETELKNYSAAVNNEALSTAEGKLTKEGHESVAKLLEEIPEKFHNTSFADEYEAYLENKAKDGKVGKNFDEWLEERPKQGGISGMLDNVKLLMAKTGLSKIFKMMFGPDNWIGKLFGSEEENEESEEDEQAFKDSTFTNKQAWEHAKLAKGEEKKEKVADLSWTGVNIKDIPVGVDGNPDLSSVDGNDLPDLEKIISAKEESAVGFARTKGLPLADLIWLQGAEENTENSIVGTSEGFKMMVDGETQLIEYTSEAIAEVQKESSEEGKLEKIVGKEYVDRFEADVEIPSALLDGETLNPALMSLLEDIKPERWKNKNGDMYKITQDDLHAFKSKLGSDFSNAGDAFEEADDSDDYYEEGLKEETNGAGATLIEANGSSNWYGLWKDDYRFENVKTLFEWLKD